MRKKTVAGFLLILLMTAVFSAAAEGQAAVFSKENGWTFVSFGRMAQDSPDDASGIVWRVLSADEKQAVLLSEKVLSCGRMDGDDQGFRGWESSELYAWLNGAFADEAFSPDEQACLMYQEDLSLVSLPSADTLIQTLPDEEGRRAAGTREAARQGLFVSSDGKRCTYWTKSAGPSFENAVYRVLEDGTFSEILPDAGNLGIRPMVLLGLEGVSVLSGAGTENEPFTLDLPDAAARAPRVSPTPRPTASPAPAETPAPAPSPVAEGPAEEGERLFPTEYESIFPELTEEGFLPEGAEEFVYQDPERGLWLYAGRDLRIEILRREDTSKKKKPKRWLEAEIFVRKDAAQQSLTYYFAGQEAKSGVLADELEIARENSLVFAVNGDWYYYRAQQNQKKRTTVGVVLRGGQILYDDPGRKDVTTLPTRDIVALYPDGRMEAYDFNGVTGGELLQKGAAETLCFGPLLVRDGEITAKTKKISAKQAENPRCGAGQIGPGHFLAVVAEGGTKQAVGMKLDEFAALFAQKGCRTAINLNGGPAAQMMFMGSYISENKAGSKNLQQNEVLGIGVSDR